MSKPSMPALQLSLLLLDPVAAALLLAALLVTAGCTLGVSALLPAPFGAGHLPWLVLAAALAPHSPVLSLVTLADAAESAPPSEVCEISALHQLAPPVARAAACSVLCLALAGLLLPLQYVRSLASLLAVVVAIGALQALVVLPLLHAVTRRPPRPAGGADSGKSEASFLKDAPKPSSFHTVP